MNTEVGGESEIIADSEAAMKAFGARLGAELHGGEVIELVGDVGAGKTTLVKGIAEGMGISEDVQSPTFTISRVYDSLRGIRLSHYDFYRLNDPGILAAELEETVHDQTTVTIIEWAEIVSGVLPDDRLTIELAPLSETSRRLRLQPHGPMSRRIVEATR